MKRPLVILTLSLSLGILAGTYPAASLFLCFGAIFFRKKIFFDFFIISLVFLSGVVLWRNSQSLPHRHLVHYVFYGAPEPYLVKGVINTEPEEKNGKINFIFQAEEIQVGNSRRACCGGILVYLKSGGEFSYGEELILKGNIYRPYAPAGSQKSYRKYLESQGIFFLMQVKNSACVVRLNKNRGSPVKKFAFWLKNKMQATINKYLSPVPASVLEAMILGEKRNIPPLVYQSMMKTGTVHILVVSGFNVGIVAFILALLLKIIRVHKKIRFAAAFFILILYCLLTGASTPVIRATVMAIMFMSAYWLKREPDIYNSLSLSALFILIPNPRQLFDIGFQLSFASVWAIVYLYPRLRILLRADTLKIKPLNFMLEGFLVSFSAWLGTLGIIAYHFRTVSLIAVFANMLIVPLATLITLSGFSLIMAHLVFSPLAGLLAVSTEFVVMVLLQANKFLVSLPLAYMCLS